MIILGSFLEVVGGFLVFVLAAFVVVFLISLFGRLTNTTFVTRGGAKIEPFKTPKERKDEIEKAKQEQELLNRVQDRNKVLNEFCREFGVQTSSNEEDKLTKMVRIESERLSYGSYLGDSFGILSYAAKEIEEKGNADFVLENYAKIKELKLNGEINNEQYKLMGSQIYEKARNKENLI